jgi:hypothetical protein
MPRRRSFSPVWGRLRNRSSGGLQTTNAAVFTEPATWTSSRLTGKVEWRWAGSQRMLGHLSGLPLIRPSK